MEKTPTNQTPSECKHYGKRNFFEWLMDDFPHCKCPNKESGICIWRSDSRANCPNYDELSKYDPSLEVRHSDGDVEGFIVCDVSVKECDGETFIELD